MPDNVEKLHTVKCSVLKNKVRASSYDAAYPRFELWLVVQPMIACFAGLVAPESCRMPGL